MPAYDYTCRDCGKAFEVRMSMAAYSEGVTPACPGCGSQRAERSFGAVNVVTGSRCGGSPAAGTGCGPGGFT